MEAQSEANSGDGNFFKVIKDKRPRACIYVTSDMTSSLIPQFSSEDVVAVRVNNVRRKEDSFVFA